MARHIHADLIIEWANGAIIQRRFKNGTWLDVCRNQPGWSENGEYRIKPKDKVKVYRWAYQLDEAGPPYITIEHYKDEEELFKDVSIRRARFSARLDWTVQEREVD